MRTTIALATLVATTWVLGADPCPASITFLGCAGSSTNGRVCVRWTDAGVADSSVATFGMTPAALYSDTTLQSAVSHTLSQDQGYLQASASLHLAAAGAADSTAPVATCGAPGTVGLWVYDYGVNSPPARGTQSRLDLALRYQADVPTIYWEVRDASEDGVPNPPPGPPGDAYMTGLPVVPFQPVTVGSAPNTGELDLGAVLETVRADGQPSDWYLDWRFEVYLSDVPIAGLVASVPEVPTTLLSLAAPRPNPARSGSTLEFMLPHVARARLDILDIAGRRLRTVAEGVFAPGAHAARWDARDAAGAPDPAGVYFVRLTTGHEMRTRKLVLLP